MTDLFAVLIWLCLGLLWWELAVLVVMAFHSVRNRDPEGLDDPGYREIRNVRGIR